MLDEMVGRIRHRILLNYRMDPATVQRMLPPPFRPKLVGGVAIGGICQVSLDRMRPRGLPAALGAASHNAAHRIAVVYDAPDGEREGVYIPRRDTDSAINAWAGGRLFPGAYTKARFAVESDGERFRVRVDDAAGAMVMRIDAALAGSAGLPATSVFASVGEVSAFFEAGATGWSATDAPDRFDTIELRTVGWRVEPLHVAEHASSFFGDVTRFPEGTVAFDCALVMRDLEHRWVRHHEVCAVCA